MANPNVPSGLTPIMSDGKPWSGQGMMGLIPSSVGVNVGRGQALVPLGGTDAYGVIKVGPATVGATNPILGCMMGVTNGPYGKPVPVLQSTTIYAASGVDTYVLMTTDPEQLYSIQEDSVGGAIAAANGAFKNSNLVAGAGVDTYTGLSGQMLDSSVVATDATYQLKLLGLLRGPENAIGDYAKWVVRINLSAMAQAAGF